MALLRAAPALSLVGLLLAACSSDGSGGPEVPEGCDPVVPELCALPWPSDFHTRADASSPTGLRLDFAAESLPINREEQRVSPAPLNQLDGFSPVSQIVFVLPGATTTGLAPMEDMGASLAADSPTVLLDIERGERVAHFVEQDARDSVFNVPYPERALILRPATRLRDGARYAVGVRGLVDAAGAVLPPGTGFRRQQQAAHVAPAVAALEAEGVTDLQLAWAFTVGANSSRTKKLLHMRDEALRIMEEAGYTHEILSVTEDVDEHTARVVNGRFRVPQFMTGEGTGHNLRLGDDGLPVAEGFTWAPFTLAVPQQLADMPRAVPLLQYGHGLLVTAESNIGGERGAFLRRMAERHGFIAAGTNWTGLSMPELGWLVDVPVKDVSEFPKVPELLHQGVINGLLLPRAILRSVADDPALQQDDVRLIADETPWYYGNSLGGIMGAVLMAISPDLHRGVLGVGGMSFSMMLYRSTDFSPFAVLVDRFYPDMLSQLLLMQIMQLTWDAAEGASYTQHIRPGGLGGAPPKEVLLHLAWEDAQVPNIATGLLARTLGAAHLEPTARPIYGLPTVSAPARDAVLVDWDFQVDPNPRENLPPPRDLGSHEGVRELDEAMTQIEHFLRTGEVISACDGACDPQ